jgi:TolA-binding protein
MTLPADNNSDHDKKPDSAETSKALQTAGSSPVNPFLAAAAEDVPGTPSRAWLSRALDYSAHVAIIAGLIGFAWTVGDHVVSRPGGKSDSPAPLAAAAPESRPVDEIGQLKLANQKMHDEIKALRASLETLRTSVRRDTTPEQVRMLSAGLETMKSNMGTTNAALAQLNGKVDKLQPQKVQQLTERLARLEHQALDATATGSIGKSDGARPDTKSDDQKMTPKPPVKPSTLASAEDTPVTPEDAKPQIIAGWVVRDVYQGVALVEGKRGSMEVVPGVTIPGAGTVKSIERHNGAWTVTTTKGQFASAAPVQREYRRYPRGIYAPYRYDY